MKSITFMTIGCKLNRFETEQMREAAEDCGYTTDRQSARADIYVINTCAVTSKSDCRSRQAVRRAIRANPRALIIVTGCYAQRSPQTVAEIAGVDLVIGNAEKDNIEAYLEIAKRAEPLVEVGKIDHTGELRSRRDLHGFGGYTRAFVKIQDGCDNRCTYCAVPSARGRSRSKSPADVGREIENLVQTGFQEAVLTGVHLGSYGRDLVPQTSLAELLRRIAPTDRLSRLRLSSVEPTDLSADLIRFLGDRTSKLCRHVHVPLQSGDDGILRAMGRPYGGARYRAVIESVAARVPDCGIGADVMVGFPGEDERAFANTYDLLKSLPITYLHVFGFSPREGTPALGLAGQVDPETKRKRSGIIRQLGCEKSLSFRQSLVGKTLETIVLGLTIGGHAVGLSDNYVRIFFDGDPAPNTIVRARIKSIRDGGLEATTCGD
ncbi:MAG: tRNA (N(6)-L-threonylcarbamoyladenosine(37)-C(2))-methylthiotransferase MtaB [Candidatus Eisenbacteria bacterium]